jgi:hypothetical protein
MLVIDIKLGKGGIKGWDVARRARAINPGLPVIYITGAMRTNGPSKGCLRASFCLSPLRQRSLLPPWRSF